MLRHQAALLTVVDLAQVQHLTLHRPPARHPAVLHDAPAAMLLTVLAANLVAEKHATRFRHSLTAPQPPWSAPQTIVHRSATTPPSRSSACTRRKSAKFSNPARVAKVGLAQRKNGYRHNGYRQITVLLHRAGWAVNHKRVARIRREDNLLCVPKLSFRPPPTDSRHGWRVWPNLARHLVPMAINHLWVADITLGSSPRACLYKAARRVRLSGCCAGCIRPARGWLGDGGAFASRASAGCVGHGDCQSQCDARRAGPSLGSRRAICLRRIHCSS